MPHSKLVILLFMLMGPIGIIPIVASYTAGADGTLLRNIANRAFLFAAAAIVLAVSLGAVVLEQWGISRPSLIMAAGLLLLIASLRQTLGLTPPPTVPASPNLSMALSPIAFPTMISPPAVGVLIMFVAYFPTVQYKVTILGTALAILALDYVAMRTARTIMAAVGFAPLTVLGAVFGVLQVALGIEMFAAGLARASL